MQNKNYFHASTHSHVNFKRRTTRKDRKGEKERKEEGTTEKRKKKTSYQC